MKPHQINKNLKAKATRNTKVAGPGAAVTFALSGNSREFNVEKPSFDGTVSIPAAVINAALTSGKDIDLKCNIDVIGVSVYSYYNIKHAHDAGVITSLRIEAESLKEDMAYNQAKEYDTDSKDPSTAEVYSAEDFVYSHGWTRAAAPKTIEFKCQLSLSGDRLDGDVQAIATMTLADELTYAYEDVDEDDEDEVTEASTKTGSAMKTHVRNKNLRVAADDLGDSKQPAMRPIFRKVAPQLVKPFQKAMRTVPSTTKKKLIQTYFGKVKLQGDVTSKKNQKLLRDTLVAAVKRDLGWMEFVAEQILDASTAELAAVLGGTERAASTKTAGIDSIYEGNYPSSESDFDGIEFPVTFKTMGQSDSWYRLDAVAREAGFSDGTTITLDSAEEAIQLFSDLDAEADEYENQQQTEMFEGFEYDPEDSEYEDEDEARQAYYDEVYGDYMGDVHEPAAILARQIGLD